MFFTLPKVFAEMMEKGRTKVKKVFNIYHQNSNDGRQVYDNSGREEVNVVEPMFSDTKLDANTGASGEGIKTQGRFAGNFGVKREVGKWAYSGNLGISTEYDYQSFNGSLNVSRSFAKDNFTIGLGVKYFNDKVKLFDDLTPAGSAKISDWQDRNIFSTSLTASQILTRKDLLQGGVTFVRATKNLESTASSTIVNGVRELEKMPDSRSRYALSTKWIHAMSEEDALHFSYRYYFDQWDLDAHTAEASYLRELNDDEDFIKFSLRIHDQSSVSFYGESFASIQDIRTSDSDLSAFTSYETSVFYSKNLKDKKVFGISLNDVSWNHGLTYASRDTGLRYGFYQTSFGYSF